MMLPTQKKDRVIPVISVIVAVKNGVSTLQTCIDSFAIQTLTEKELIVIDGASDDGTLEVIKKNNHNIYYWESSPDRGIAHAWNKALRHARGEWIIFLGADDCFYDCRTMEKYIDFIMPFSKKFFRIVYGSVQLVLHNGKVLSLHGEAWKKIKSKFFSEKMMIPHQACFHHRTLFIRGSGFDDKFKIASDYDLLVRALKYEEPLFLPGFIVCNMGFNGISTQISSLRKMQLEFNNVLIKNRLIPNSVKSKLNLFFYKLYEYIEKYFGKRSSAFLIDFIRIMIGKRRIFTIR